MPGQPRVVSLAGQPDHGGTRLPGQLDRDRADPARRSGDRHRVAPVRPTARTAAYAVVPATNSAPASSHGTPAGLAVRCCSSTTTYSAWLARLSVQPMTSSPAAFGLRDNRRRELDAAAGKPAPPGDPAEPHHDFVTRPDGGHNHVNH